MRLTLRETRVPDGHAETGVTASPHPIGGEAEHEQSILPGT